MRQNPRPERAIEWSPLRSFGPATCELWERASRCGRASRAGRRARQRVEGCRRANVGAGRSVALGIGEMIAAPSGLRAGTGIVAAPGPTTHRIPLRSAANAHACGCSFRVRCKSGRGGVLRRFGVVTVTLICVVGLASVIAGAGPLKRAHGQTAGAASASLPTVTLLMGAAPGSLDPGVSYTFQAMEPDWLAYTGLVTYAHAGGSAGEG